MSLGALADITDYRPKATLKGPGSKRDIKVKSKFSWKKNKEGVYEIRWFAKLESDIEVAPPKKKQKGMVIKSTGIFFISTNLKKTYRFGDGQSITINWAEKIKKPMQKNCKDLKLELVSMQESDDQVYSAVYCEDMKDKIRVHLTMPKEVDVISSNIFDILGKGSNARAYDIEKSNLGGDVLGKLEIYY
ncbi:MAG: hypothetical protein HRT45_19755, partial [Bdellovibrionales bacterium]|nr:hypothetical protein [Bdellovibrionales bacterium]